MRTTLAASGPATVAAAWERYADPDAWRTWSPQITGVEREAGARLHPGLRGTVVGRAGLRVDFVVEAVEPPATGPASVGSWAWSVRPTRAGVALPAAWERLGSMRLEHAVLPGPGGRGCTTTLVTTGAAPVVLAYAPLALAALRRLVR